MYSSMYSVTLSKSTAQSTSLGNYRVDMTISAAESITQFLFVKQRTLLADGTNDDTFVTVASPAQIAEIQQSTPTKDSSYFRDNAISLISSDPEFIQQIADDILADIQLTLQQASDLDGMSAPETIIITPSAVTVS